MSRESTTMGFTVELVSAYMNCMNCTGLFTDDDSAKRYAEFIETIYKKVEELTATK